MKLLWVMMFAVTAWAQPTVIRTSSLDAPRIDGMEFYGLHQVTETLVREALGLKEGDPLPASKGEAEDRLLDIDRVVSAQLRAVCCDNGKTILYVGIEEYGAPHYDIRTAPGGAAVLPEGITAGTKSVKQIDGHLEEIRDVLRDSNEDIQRAVAAALLPLTSRPAEIVDDLHEALTDADNTVRTNALHGLQEMAQIGRDPAARMRISPTWFVPMLNSIYWTDRTQAAVALESVTRLQADPAVLAAIRAQALDALIEMSKWHNEQYAYPPFVLIARVAGVPEVQIHDAWLRGGREEVVARARAVK